MTTLVDALAGLIAARVPGLDYSTTRALDPAKTPITVGAFPPTTGAAVALTTYGGPEPDLRNGWQYPRLQVRVRSKHPYGALGLDDDVAAALKPTGTPVLVAGWLLQDCYPVTSGAEPMGVDANGRHEYVRNYQLSVEPAG